MSVTVELDYQPLPTQARFHASPAKFGRVPSSV